MNTLFDHGQTKDRIVYVKTVKVADLPDDLRLHAGDRETIVSVHSTTGEQLALVMNRQLAFHLAREHDMNPVNVH